VKLTNITGCALNPVWSPDGQSFAFVEVTHDPPNSASVKSWKINVTDGSGNNVIPISSGNDKEPLFLTWSPVPTLQANNTYSLTALGTNLNLRESPSLTSIIVEKLKEGNIINVLSGPVQADGYFWWSVSTDKNVQGWVADVSGWYILHE